ncbi:UNVERIFIED_CONTAM: hypothetical protein NCL1_19758 [Trichonephila clavipes]
MPNATCRMCCTLLQSLTFRGCPMLFFSRIMPTHTLLASPNMLYERTLLISHPSNTCGMSLDAVCKFCPCLVRTTNFGKWLKGMENHPSGQQPHSY